MKKHSRLVDGRIKFFFIFSFELVFIKSMDDKTKMNHLSDIFRSFWGAWGIIEER